jgi:FAD/FMN-containing dehydrogenase
LDILGKPRDKVGHRCGDARQLLAPSAARLGACARRFRRRKSSGPAILKNDVAVLIASIPEFIARADAAVLGLCPGARTLAFGHLGDGNVPSNSCPAGAVPRAQFPALWAPVACGGSIARNPEGARSALELELMGPSKRAFDPKGILNPGKVFIAGSGARECLARRGRASRPPRALFVY